jgi:hypothetical protein
LRSHQQYAAFVERHAATLAKPCRHLHVMYVLSQLNLDPLRPLVAHLYSTRMGAPAIAPEDMLRSLLAMVLCGVFSFDVWVDMMRSQPFYAVISGFEPDHVPAVGTFCLFADRLLGLIEHPPKHTRKPKAKAKDTFSQSKDKNKDTPKHQGIVERLAKRITRTGKLIKQADWKLPATAKFPRYEAVLQTIFYTLFVPHSVELGLIDLDNLYVTGDSTKLGTYANSHGKRLCKCPKDQPCTCKRRYQDFLARWGWDSYRQAFVYGHSLYELCAYCLDHRVQLPLVLSLFDANRHDSILGLAALYQALNQLQLPLKVATFDKASDALPFYRLGYEYWELSLVVAINQRFGGHGAFPTLKLDDNGIPHCPAGLPMYCWGHCGKRHRIKWRCPLKATLSGQRAYPQGCAHEHHCSQSAYGRVVYTYPKDNYRIFTPIPRGSPLWDTHYHHHSASERSHKRKKLDYNLDSTRTAGRERIFLRAMLAAMAQHLQAWTALAQQKAEGHTLDPAA